MVNETGFFNSEGGDRTYNAEDVTGFYADFFTNGIVADNTSYLQVTANNGMNLWVLKGKAYINGGFFKPKTSKGITLPDSDTTYPRYDIVVLRWDKIARDIYLDVISGESNASPKYPALTRNETTYELGLAAVYVAANSTEITQANITDLRFNNSYCGIVTGVINTINTTNLFAQFEQAWYDFVAQLGESNNVTINTADEQVRTEFAAFKTQTDTKLATNAPFKILKGTASTSSGYTTITFSKSFSGTPAILCTVSNSTTTIAYMASCYISSASSSQFTVRTKKLTATTPDNLNTTVYWVAFGT